jgi:hypothetical protein
MSGLMSQRSNTADSARRAQLHELLDRLLDADIGWELPTDLNHERCKALAELAFAEKDKDIKERNNLIADAAMMFVSEFARFFDAWAEDRARALGIDLEEEITTDAQSASARILLAELIERFLPISDYLFRIEAAEALLALNGGETQTLFQAVSTTAKGLAWSKRKLKKRALCRVNRLVALDWKEMAAFQRVAEAYDTGPSAIRNWRDREHLDAESDPDEIFKSDRPTEGVELFFLNIDGEEYQKITTPRERHRTAAGRPHK